MLEDTIELENIKIPDPLAEIELNQVLSAQIPLPPGLSIHTDPFDGLPGISPISSSASMPRTKSVPSLSTLQSVRKCIAEQVGRSGPDVQRAGEKGKEPERNNAVCDVVWCGVCCRRLIPV